jgi:hypothetical protein
MAAPPFTNQPPNEIIGGKQHFDSAWLIWKSLAWLDYAKKNTNFSALQYAALELRQGIEQLWFDIIHTLGGGHLEEAEYLHCKQNATKMYKVIDRMEPNYQKLVRFTNICCSLDPRLPRIIEWNMSQLKRTHWEMGKYLHFNGAPSETTQNPEWFVKAITVIETGASEIWTNLTTNRVGQMRVTEMEPEVRQAWEQFLAEQLSEDSVRTRLKIAQPILHDRRISRQLGASS